MAASEQVDTKKAILNALELYHGIVTDSCGSIGLSRSTFYDWLKTDAEFKAAVDEIQDTALDFVEGKLFQKINGVTLAGRSGEDGEPLVYEQPPSDTAIIFYLKTRGKKRGYIERTEVTGADGKAIVTETHVKIIRDKGIESSPVETPLKPAEGTE